MRPSTRTSSCLNARARGPLVSAPNNSARSGLLGNERGRAAPRARVFAADQSNEENSSVWAQLATRETAGNNATDSTKTHSSRSDEKLAPSSVRDRLAASASNETSCA